MVSLHAREPARFARRSSSGWQRQQRRGAIAVFAAILMIVMLVAAAFAIDIGMVCQAKAELQRAADASALAATSELLRREVQQPNNLVDVVVSQGVFIRQVADDVVQNNKIFCKSANLSLNLANDQGGEIVIGEMVRNGDSATVRLSDPSQYNSVEVRVRQTADRNGELPLFFANVIGMNKFATEAVAQAFFVKQFSGFRVPSGSSNPPPTLAMFPFAIDRATWNNVVQGNGPDDYGWDKDHNRVDSGRGDGVQEINLYPLDTGAAGNFGTVDIGSNNSMNSTLSRQIIEGLSRSDLDYHGGQLALDSTGKLMLSGDPGLKVGAVLPALQQIIGQTRIVPLYSSISDSGQKSQFTITAFGACRVMAVDLHGNAKHLTVQPTPMITRGGIPGNGSNSSSHIFSPVVLVK